MHFYHAQICTSKVTSIFQATVKVQLKLVFDTVLDGGLIYSPPLVVRTVAMRKILRAARIFDAQEQLGEDAAGEDRRTGGG